MTAGRKAPPLSATPVQVAEATVDALRRGRAVVYVPRSMRAVATVVRLLPRALVRRLPR
jgi:short-subunit dehydrogenase